MRTLLQALTELVEPRLIQGGPLVLREDDPTSTCAPTTLERKGLALTLRLGPWRYSEGLEIPLNRWIFPLFNLGHDRPVCRSCDYIVFYAPHADKSALFVFLCELKSSRGRGAMAQLRNGKLLADHVLSVVRLHGQVERWPADIAFRGLIFAGDAPLQKGATRPPGAVDYSVDAQLPTLATTVQRAGRSYALDSFCA